MSKASAFRSCASREVNVEQYFRDLSRFLEEHNPVTDEERELVQCTADIAWRLLLTTSFYRRI